MNVALFFFITYFTCIFANSIKFPSRFESTATSCQKERINGKHAVLIDLVWPALVWIGSSEYSQSYCYLKNEKNREFKSRKMHKFIEFIITNHFKYSFNCFRSLNNENSPDLLKKYRSIDVIKWIIWHLTHTFVGQLINITNTWIDYWKVIAFCIIEDEFCVYFISDFKIFTVNVGIWMRIIIFGFKLKI